MSEITRIITLKKNIPEGTTKAVGFHLLDMGKQGLWLVDEHHPGYNGCVSRAIRIATKNKDTDLVRKYSKLPKGKDPKAFEPLIEEEQEQVDEMEHTINDRGVKVYRQTREGAEAIRKQRSSKKKGK